MATAAATATATSSVAMGQFEDAVTMNQPSTTLTNWEDFDYEDNDEDDDDNDDDFYQYDDHDNPIVGGSGTSGSANNYNHSGSSTKKMNVSHAVSNTVQKMQQLEVKKRTLHTSRDDRATSEQCLDPRTRLMLFKMLSSGLLEEIDGCLSTGKEANVYYAKAGKRNALQNVTEYAIKIYKTSILVFKDRDKYVSGEHRWRKGYCKFALPMNHYAHYYM